MSDYKDCKVCREAQRRKHKYDKVWKIAAVVSAILAVVFMILYFSSGTVIETTEFENEVEIENIGSGTQTNTNIGNVNINDNADMTKYIIVFCVFGFILICGVIYGGYALAKNNHKKQSEDYESESRRRRDPENHDKDQAK